LQDEPHDDPDAELAKQAAAGDRDAFDLLVRRYDARIVNLARALTGGDADAEDLAQEAFIRAFRGIHRFRGESAFRTWLHTIAVNVIRTHHTRRSRWRRLFAEPTDAGDDTGTEIERAAVPGFEADVVRRDAVDRALARLPEDLRLVVTLRDVQGLDYREIADVLGVPMGTVESRLFRARQKLRPMLASMMETRPATAAAVAGDGGEGQESGHGQL
jgi:RNA polymerase sigma-70 factor, ECF subfamily